MGRPYSHPRHAGRARRFSCSARGVAQDPCPPPAEHDSDGIYATTAINARFVVMQFASQPVDIGVITNVSFKFIQHADIPGNDFLGINVSTNLGVVGSWACTANTWTCNASVDYSAIAMSATDITSSVDLTLLYGSWTWAEVNSICGQIRPTRNRSEERR